MSFEPPGPKRPTYEISTEFVCERCSKPRLYVTFDYPYDYLQYDCPVNSKAPLLHSCPDFSREPGVD